MSLDIQSDQPRPHNAEEFFSFRNMLNDIQPRMTGYEPGQEPWDIYQTGVWRPIGTKG